MCYSQSDITQIEEGLTTQEVERFTGMLASLAHFSPFEHASFTFAIEGISRALSHQLVRHRLASYSQQSQRYVDMSGETFIKTDLIANNSEASEAFDIISDAIMENYHVIKNKIMQELANKYIQDNKLSYPKVIEVEDWMNWFKEIYPKEYSKIEKIANENARAILPNACETKIVVTMNVRSLFNFFDHRCCERAQTEIRLLAKEMLKQVREISPSLFKKAGPACVSGICPEGAMQCDKLKGKIPTMKDVKLLIKEYYND